MVPGRQRCASIEAIKEQNDGTFHLCAIFPLACGKSGNIDKHSCHIPTHVINISQ